LRNGFSLVERHTRRRGVMATIFLTVDEIFLIQWAGVDVCGSVLSN